MKIRYIQSVGGAEPRQANEKQKNGKWVFYEVSDFEAVRYIDSDIAVAENEDDYKKAKANYEALEAQKKQQHEISETLKNLDSMKAECDKKKTQYKELGAEIKAMDSKIKAAEATVKPTE